MWGSLICIRLQHQVERIPASEDYKLYRYDFDDKLMSDDDTIKATIRMFLDANLISQFKVPYEVCTYLKVEKFHTK